MVFNITQLEQDIQLKIRKKLESKDKTDNSKRTIIKFNVIDKS